jgi:hypothetical protein
VSERNDTVCRNGGFQKRYVTNSSQRSVGSVEKGKRENKQRTKINQREREREREKSNIICLSILHLFYYSFLIISPCATDKPVIDPVRESV